MKPLLLALLAFALLSCNDEIAPHETAEATQEDKHYEIDSIYPSHSDFVHHTSTIYAHKSTQFSRIKKDIEENTNGHTRFDLTCYDGIRSDQHLYATNTFAHLHGIPTPTLTVKLSRTGTSIDSSAYDRDSLTKKLDEHKETTLESGRRPRYLLEICDTTRYGVVYDFLHAFKDIKFEIETDFPFTVEHIAIIQHTPPPPSLISYSKPIPPEHLAIVGPYVKNPAHFELERELWKTPNLDHNVNDTTGLEEDIGISMNSWMNIEKK